MISKNDLEGRTHEEGFEIIKHVTPGSIAHTGIAAQILKLQNINERVYNLKEFSRTTNQFEKSLESLFEATDAALYNFDNDNIERYEKHLQAAEMLQNTAKRAYEEMKNLKITTEGYSEENIEIVDTYLEETKKGLNSIKSLGLSEETEKYCQEYQKPATS